MKTVILPHNNKIRCVATDVDGVMNSGVLHFGLDGQEIIKDFHVKDGMGIKLLLEEGIVFHVITGRASPILRTRLNSLGANSIHEGVEDKLSCLKGLLEVDGILPHEVAYIGDDLNDLAVLAWLYSEGGVGFCPQDAVDIVKETALHVTSLAGGQGSLREMLDWVLWQNREHAGTD
ncbi:MAG: HAD hydrolase family protein [Candidatus Cloacimonetes bacterium]|nr:HAD hydrolase family protein [Candidatus Cloacimonadota bacterium]